MDATMELEAMADMSKELDDLGNLFEFGDIDLNNTPHSGGYGDTLQSSTEAEDSFESLSQAPAMGAVMSTQDFGDEVQYSLLQDMEQQQFLARHDSGMLAAGTYTNGPTFHPPAQQAPDLYGQNFQYQPQIGFLPGQYIPPTPNSYEMHGESGPFMQQQMHPDPQQRAIMDQRFCVPKDAVAFTPMVSPAVTPQFGMLPEFTTPGAYFSPLTSPMLHAQNLQQQQAHLQQQDQRGYAVHPSTAPSSNANSPADLNFNVQLLDDMAAPPSNGPKPRKSKRKMATPRTAAMSAKAKQSPAQGAQKRKSAPAPSDVPHIESDCNRATSSTPPLVSAKLLEFKQHDDSEAGSISPGALSDSLMGPPPRPSPSSHASPAIKGQKKSATAGNSVAAATPKSLLTTRAAQRYSNEESGGPGSASMSHDLDVIDDLLLPEAAKPGPTRPCLTQIITHIPDRSSSTNAPRTSSRKTPKLGPLSTPSSARPGSTLPSPSVVGSPMTATTPSTFFRDDRDTQSGKRRNTASASNPKLVSPALVPKISPSIQPLLPEGTPLHSANQALLLASKSNYQNLMEGTHLPGVSYPDSLSTGLTSKRTSHKVAEQGRRNRINDALKEMQSLVPKRDKSKSPHNNKDKDKDNEMDGGDGSPPDLNDDASTTVKGGAKESKEEAQARSNNSKAATVELANEYIRRIQQESAAQSAHLAELTRENELLKKRLALQEVEQSGGGSGASAGGGSSPSRSAGSTRASAEA